jgi:hypothetical protein
VLYVSYPFVIEVVDAKLLQFGGRNAQDELHLEPGKHKVTVRDVRHSNSTKEEERNFEAGHTYRLRAEKMNLVVLGGDLGMAGALWLLYIDDVSSGTSGTQSK